MKYICFIFIILLISCNYIGNDKIRVNQIDTSIIGVYKKGFAERGTKLTINSDGTFINENYYNSDYVREGEPNGRITQINGFFKTDSNRIILYPEVYLRKLNYIDSIVLLDSLKYYKSDSTFINTEFTIIKWVGNVYFLSEDSNYRFGYRVDNDFVVFADNYNSGSEPKWHDTYFSKRIKNSKFKKMYLKQIPIKWRKYFLDSIVSVVVTKIEPKFMFDSAFHTYIYRYTLKGGLNNGILEGMTFYGNDGCSILKIMEVDNKTSKGVIELCPFQQNSCKIGDTLTSRNIREYGNYVP